MFFFLEKCEKLSLIRLHMDSYIFMMCFILLLQGTKYENFY